MATPPPQHIRLNTLAHLRNSNFKTKSWKEGGNNTRGKNEFIMIIIVSKHQSTTCICCVCVCCSGLNNSFKPSVHYNIHHFTKSIKWSYSNMKWCMLWWTDGLKLLFSPLQHTHTPLYIRVWPLDTLRVRSEYDLFIRRPSYSSLRIIVVILFILYNFIL